MLTLKPAKPSSSVPMNRTADDMGIPKLTATALKVMVLTEVLTDRRPGR